jgi:NADH dehydrogenase/NADH:ubiquinone oxidoreductase subunit G
MGALTLKSFPFELRGWDIEKFESIDPTDGFGTNTRVYISKQQVIQIEPNQSTDPSNVWLSDKGRQFFDGIFGIWNQENKSNKTLVIKKEDWKKNIKKILQTIYLFKHCSTQTTTKYFLTFILENLGVEMLALLKLMEQNYSFLKLRRAENLNFKNDLEFNFQLSTITELNKLKQSTLCFLIATDPRYEGYRLNLQLRQRFFKGGFKCLVLGSLKSLTFPTTFIGTHFNILKTIVEGTSFLCQDIQTAKNPFIVLGSDFFKRTDAKSTLTLLSQVMNQTNKRINWNGLNYLHANLNEVGTNTIGNFLPIQKKDFNEFNSFYFLNVSTQNVANLKKIIESKLLGYLTSSKQPCIEKTFLDQNNHTEKNQNFIQSLLQSDISKNYSFLPVKMFYENQETFINTEGLIKKTNKLITTRKTREGWGLLRNLVKNITNYSHSLNFKNNNSLMLNIITKNYFKKFVVFHYCAVNKLDNSTYLFLNQNEPFFIANAQLKFKQDALKIKNTKLKYWLDDFFTGGNDVYSKNSLIMSNCSKILRDQHTNFF